VDVVLPVPPATFLLLFKLADDDEEEEEDDEEEVEEDEDPSLPTLAILYFPNRIEANKVLSYWG